MEERDLKKRMSVMVGEYQRDVGTYHSQGRKEREEEER